MVSQFKRFIVDNYPAHKWIIFVFDLVVAGMAFMVSRYVLSAAGLVTGSLSFGFQLLLIILTNAAFFFFFKTGEAIPAQKDFKNVLRSLDAISGSFIALMLLNLFLKMTGKPPLITNFVLILSAAASIFLIGGYRLISGLTLRQTSIGINTANTGNMLGASTANEYQRHTQAVLQMIRSKKILITGAAGSIGSGLAHQVAAIKHVQLILCDQNETGLYQLEYALTSKYPGQPKPIIYIGDIRDEAAMENLFKQYTPQIIFHAAAYKHVPLMEANPCEAVRNNVFGTKVLADLAVKYRAERFLFVSTDKAINPASVMGASKRIAEMYVQAVAGDKNSQAITRFITTRFGNVLGSNGSVILRFQEQIAAGGPVTVTHPEMRRYFMTISEACALVLEAVSMGNGGEVYRFDMGEPVLITDLATKMISDAGLKPGVDIKITYTGLRPGEKLYEEVLNSVEEVITNSNKKIWVAKVAAYDFNTIHNAINVLMQASAENNHEAVVQEMKRLVADYISNNSVYESLDNGGTQKKHLAI